MAYINKETRKKVWYKYGCKCAYCGVDLDYNKLQVDHVEPRWNNDTDESAERIGVIKGSHSEDNFNPSCARCNRWKGTYSLEGFRREISLQINRLERDSSQFRMAKDYGLIKETNEPVLFWFEKYEQELNRIKE